MCNLKQNLYLFYYNQSSTKAHLKKNPNYRWTETTRLTFIVVFSNLSEISHSFIQGPCSEIQICSVLSVSSLQFQRSTFQFLSQYDLVLITIAFWYNVESDWLMPSAVPLLFSVVLYILDYLVFPMKLGIIIFRYMRNCATILKGIQRICRLLLVG